MTANLATLRRLLRTARQRHTLALQRQPTAPPERQAAIMAQLATEERRIGQLEAMVDAEAQRVCCGDWVI